MVTCAANIDKRTDCRNCGEKGHQQKDCKERKFCPVCDTVGHCAGNGGGCPVTLKKARQATANKDVDASNLRMENVQQTAATTTTITTTITTQ